MNPVNYVIATFDEKSKVKRIEVSEFREEECVESVGRYSTIIDENEDYRSIQEISRTSDSDKEMVRHIDEKFGRKGACVDVKARAAFCSGYAKAQINCCFGFNTCR